ncbi:MAG: RNA polymerase sigma factor RpoD/SigA [Candidatus Cloacimonetes bacterium]|jgi:RNA polymerase primary sigma factor|nr:RNA polymerase sigma factor RpoD/SigA [Candidatus Cloacimonadota bacterium]MDD4157178.1 RNA polymerase sigma factor RpoD/SigA [Candidatus Cloacimonadota bacterium]
MENVFDDKALQSYLNSIAKYPSLSKEEEKKYAILAKQGNKKAKDKLINSNLKFVVKIASNYQNRGLSLSELISEGNLGLIKAIEKFDPEKDIKLISYAVWWIKQKILFALAEKTSLIRVPVGLSQTASKIRNAKEKIKVEQGIDASSELISDETDLSSKVIRQVSDAVTDTLSIDEMNYNSTNDDLNIFDYIANNDTDDPKSLYYKEKLQNRIDKSINKLEYREAFIIKSYYGLDGYQEKNFAEIAQEIGLSRERVRQIQKKILKKIFNETYAEQENDIDLLLSNTY